MERGYKGHRSEGGYGYDVGHDSGAGASSGGYGGGAPSGGADSSNPSGIVNMEEYAQAKADRRREERQAKKEADARYDFFKAVETALMAVSAQQRERAALGAEAEGDTPAGGTSDILDGFCTELAKSVNADPASLLNNKAVCRTIELALSAAEPRHVRAVAYTFLGRIPMLASTPTASFVLETLFAALYRALGAKHAPAEDGTTVAAAAEDEDEEGRGMPPLEMLLKMAGRELAESTASLLWERGGSKCIAGAITVAAGFPIRSVPAHSNYADFELADELMAAVRRQLDQPSFSAAHRAAFADACFHVSACFVVQAMLRAVAAKKLGGFEGADHEQFIRGQMNPLLLSELMADKVGSRVVECYASTGDPSAWRLVLETVVAAILKEDSFIPAFAVISLIEGCRSEASVTELWETVFCRDPDTLRGWIAFRASEPLMKPLLGDVVDKDADKPQGSRAPHPLIAFVTALAPTDAGLDPTLDAAAAPDDAKAAKKLKDSQKRSTNTGFPATTTDFRRGVLNTICAAMKGESSKGPAHALLVKGIAGEPGTKLCEELFRFGRIAATPLVRSVISMAAADLPNVAMAPGGSRALQRFVDCVAAESAARCQPEPQAGAGSSADATVEMVPMSGGALRMWRKEKLAEQKKIGVLAGKLGPPPKVPKPISAAERKRLAAEQQKQQQVDPSPLLRFARRIAPAISQLCVAKFGSFLVQHVYAQGALDVRRCVCQALADNYGQLKQHYLARVVLVHCHVEQFLYRNDEWKAQMERQAKVKKVMAAVVAAEEAYEHNVNTSSGKPAASTTTGGDDTAKADRKGKHNSKNQKGQKAEQKPQGRAGKKAPVVNAKHIHSKVKQTLANLPLKPKADAAAPPAAAPAAAEE